MRLIVPLFLFASLSAGSVAARAEVVGFRSPSGNVHCQLFVGDRKTDTTLRCDVAEMAVTPKRPSDCDLDWGRAFEIATTSGRGERLCHGDTVMDTTLPVLPYDQTWQRAGMTCRSEETGITCFNAKRHGFTVSRATQTLF